MPTNNPRVSFALTEELLKQIDEFRYANRIKNQTQAIITLINRGFEALADGSIQTLPLAPDESKLIDEYRSAPNEIKQAAHNILAPYAKAPIKKRA